MFNPYLDNIEDESVRDRMAEHAPEELALAGELYHAAHALANADSDHAVPSPSGVADCRLKQWFAATETPRTNPIGPASYKKMETGRHIEQFWHTIYEQAGFDVLETPESEPFDNYKGGRGDGILVVRTPELAKTLHLKVGDRGLLELKDLGMFTFDDYVMHGADGNDIEHYKVQTQVYLGRYGLKFGVLHAGQADNSATTWYWSKIRKRKGYPPPFMIEMIYPDPMVYDYYNNRAGEVAWYAKHVSKPPVELKDFDPDKGRFPCGSDVRPYCSWRDICKGVQ